MNEVYRDRLNQYSRANPQGKYGTHHYAASEFGYTNEAVRGRFVAYNERFGFAV